MFNSIEDIVQFFNDRKKLGIQLGLDRIHELLKLLNHPEQKIKGIHVAGTNGKGSTIQFMNNALLANGYNVGIFTSPSFDGLTGHILLNGEKISEEQFIKLFQKIYPKLKLLDQSGIHPTEFEILTAIAFLAFSKHTEIALIETGMGGRYDTTNCFLPILSIITNIDNDHEDFLGKTIQEIAHHKSGIIKEKIPVIVGDVNEEALSVINEEIEKNASPLYILNHDFSYEIISEGDKQKYLWKDGKDEFTVQISMLGEHQIKNSSLAIMALKLLNSEDIQLNFHRSLEGIFSTSLPGRFELITKNNQTIILDSSHNFAGVQTFLQTVETNFGQIHQKQLIFAAFKDKDIKLMLEQLIPNFIKVTLTTFDHPRAATTTFLLSMIDGVRGNVEVKKLDEIIEGFQQVDDQTGYYFFTGSLHFIAEVRKLLLN